MKLLFAIGVASVLAAAPAPALAQSDKQPQLDRAYLRYAATARTMRKLTDCVVRRNPEGARSLFGLPAGSAKQGQAMAELFKGAGNCLTGTGTYQLNTSMFMALGSIAENLIGADAVEAAAPASPPIPAGGGSYDWTILRLTPSSEPKLYPVAQCLLVMHPEWTRALLATKPVSKGEREFYLASGSTLRDCIPAGTQMTLHPMYLRSALATMTYSAARN